MLAAKWFLIGIALACLMAGIIVITAATTMDNDGLKAISWVFSGITAMTCFCIVKACDEAFSTIRILAPSRP